MEILKSAGVLYIMEQIIVHISEVSGWLIKLKKADEEPLLWALLLWFWQRRFCCCG